MKKDERKNQLKLHKKSFTCQVRLGIDRVWPRKGPESRWSSYVLFPSVFLSCRPSGKAAFSCGFSLYEAAAPLLGPFLLGRSCWSVFLSRSCLSSVCILPSCRSCLFCTAKTKRKALAQLSLSRRVWWVYLAWLAGLLLLAVNFDGLQLCSLAL